MNQKPKAVLMVLAIAAAIGVGAWRIHRASQPVDLALHFHAFVGAEPLALNDPSYPNPGGEGRFKVRDFQFFLSNIRLVGPNGAFVETESYHAVRFDGDEPGFVILLRAVPRRGYDRIEFGIGVDPAANGTLMQRGDLDPNSRMAWNWEVGYKFMLFEGALLRGDASEPLVYHVGFDESYTPVSAALPSKPLDLRPARLDFRVDIMRLFAGTPPVDMAALPTVKFNRPDTERIARNFGDLVTPMWAEAPAQSDEAR